MIAYPVIGADKVERVARMAARGAGMSVNVDSELGAEELSAAAVRHGTRIGVQLEVDTGLNRVGFRPDETDRLESLARFVMSLPGLELEGVTTHRGVGFEGAATMTGTEAGLAEGALLVEVAERLRAHGIPIREVTAGGTITGRAVATVPGVTEVRAGTYAFNDLMQLGYGSATPTDLALTIVCTVVSHHGDRATIDGGSKTFAGDYRIEGSTVGESGFARAVDRPVFVDRLSEEHGMITTGAGSVALGEKVAWIPSHVCPCVNLADEIYGVRDGSSRWSGASRPAGSGREISSAGTAGRVELRDATPGRTVRRRRAAAEAPFASARAGRASRSRTGSADVRHRRHRRRTQADGRLPTRRRRGHRRRRAARHARRA